MLAAGLLSATSVSADVFQVGAAIHKMYNGFDDDHGTLADLQGDPRFPDNPDRQDVMARFEYPADGINVDPADPIQDYSDTLECYFIPPTTNDYVFYVAGSDIVDLYLSTDADPANMVSITYVWDYTVPRGWMTPLSDPGATNGFRSDWYTGNMWPGAGDPSTGNALIHLDGGQLYYLFAQHHCFSWSGEGDFAVTYSYAGDPAPAVGDAPLLTGSVIASYLDPTGASVTFSQQPTNVTILNGGTATFTGLAAGQSPIYSNTNVFYQWQSAPKGSATFTDIPGETLNSYTTPVLHLSDSGTQYKLLAMLAGLVQPSSVATVTVTADTIPTLTITRNGDGTFTLAYTGTLYSSPTVTGTYNPVSGASNPWTVDPKATSAPATQYYRAGP
jgi:hypothetical protein